MLDFGNKYDCFVTICFILLKIESVLLTISFIRYTHKDAYQRPPPAHAQAQPAHAQAHAQEKPPPPPP
jgi:hypothetical protein